MALPIKLDSSLGVRLMQPPDFTNRQPIDIISDKLFFDSAGFVYRGLSWLDYAKRNGTVTTLMYSALEIRLAIEHLMFEELIMSVGCQLDKTEYEKCKGESTKFAKIIKRLSPDYRQLIIFTQTISSLIPNSPPLIEWEHEKLLKLWGDLSSFLHWAGEAKDTFESSRWFLKGLETTEHAATYLWDKMISGHSGVMMPEKMQPEIRQIWENFKSGKIDLSSVRERARIALPVLSMRRVT